MIHVVLPSKRKPALTWLEKKHQHSVHQPLFPLTAPTGTTSSNDEVTDTEGPLYQEIIRRNQIIANKLVGCTFFVGEIVKTKNLNEEELKLYGEEVEIIKIMRNTVELDRPWPKDNDPFVIMFKNCQTNKIWVANPSFFVKK